MTQRTLEELVENFSLFDDWEGRYQYLIDLGNEVPAMDDALKTPATEVKGCVSKVWLHAQKDESGVYHLRADSDGKITKGMVYIVLCAYDAKTAAQMADVDIEGAFSKLGLDQHLSPNRRNGFFAMVERVKALN